MAHDANRHVTIGDDPDQPGSLLDDRERADVLLLHQLRSLTYQRLGRDSVRPLRHHLADLRLHDRPFPRDSRPIATGCSVASRSSWPPPAPEASSRGRRRPRSALGTTVPLLHPCQGLLRSVLAARSLLLQLRHEADTPTTDRQPRKWPRGFRLLAGPEQLVDEHPHAERCSP